MTTRNENQEQLEAMLEEVKHIRRDLSRLSESAAAISKAIEGVLGDELRFSPDGPGYLEEGDFHYDDSYTEEAG